MTHLSELVAQMIDEQQDHIASMRAMIEQRSDSAALFEAVVVVDAADVRIHSLTAVLERFAALNSHRGDREG